MVLCLCACLSLGVSWCLPSFGPSWIDLRTRNYYYALIVTLNAYNYYYYHPVRATT